jgi:hypothetical protein
MIDASGEKETRRLTKRPDSAPRPRTVLGVADDADD